jgi:hypothetical protein
MVAVCDCAFPFHFCQNDSRQDALETIGRIQPSSDGRDSLIFQRFSRDIHVGQVSLDAWTLWGRNLRSRWREGGGRLTRDEGFPYFSIRERERECVGYASSFQFKVVIREPSVKLSLEALCKRVGSANDCM